MAKESVVVKGVMRNSYSLEEKVRILSELEESGMSMSKFSKRIGISAPTLCIWRQSVPRTKSPVKEVVNHLPAVQNVQPEAFMQFQEQMNGLKQENERLKTELNSFRAAFGKKLVELEMARQL